LGRVPIKAGFRGGRLSVILSDPPKIQQDLFADKSCAQPPESCGKKINFVERLIRPVNKGAPGVDRFGTRCGVKYTHLFRVLSF
jgi:hypothetical protein